MWAVETVYAVEDALRLIAAYQPPEPAAVELTRRCEQAIRNYDPCITCSAHFLELAVERS